MCHQKNSLTKSDSCQLEKSLKSESALRMGMLRRSISLGNDDNQITLSEKSEMDVSKCEQRRYSRHFSLHVIAASRLRLESESAGGWEDSDGRSSSAPYGLPCEENVGPLLQSALGQCLDDCFRIVLLPILLFVTLAYTFTYLPAPPKAEIYRSLSATFVILMGITLQCCFITGWAATRLGFGDFLMLLRYSINNQLQ